MPGVPPDAIKQVKRGLKRLFSRKKNRGQEDTANNADVVNDSATIAGPGTGNLTEAEAEANEAPVADGATTAHDEGPDIKIVGPDMPVAKAAGESEFPAAEAQPSTKVVDSATQIGASVAK